MQKTQQDTHGITDVKDEKKHKNDAKDATR